MEALQNLYSYKFFVIIVFLLSNIIKRLGQKSLSSMGAQTAGPIVPKFGMGIQEHLEIAIGYVLCTWVQGGRREGRRK